MEVTMNQKATIRKLVEIGLFVAIAVVFDFLAGLYSPFPYGGSISPAMLPIVVISYRYGVKSGLSAGFVFGVLQSFVAMGMGQFWFLSIAQFTLDYLLAFIVLGFAGLVKRPLEHKGSFLLGIGIAAFLRYVMHGLSGVVFWGMYAPEGMNVWFYSFVAYNLPYMAASLALSLILGVVLYQRKLFSIVDSKHGL
jgi:thiamine transporter